MKSISVWFFNGIGGTEEKYPIALIERRDRKNYNRYHRRVTKSSLKRLAKFSMVKKSDPFVVFNGWEFNWTD